MQLCCSFRRVQLFTFVIAASAIISVLIILFFFNYPTFAKRRIIDAMVFKNNSESMERFQTTKDLLNLRLTFYIYNVTNAKDVVEKSAKIKLEEVGPFVYSEFKEKRFVDNNQTSGLITYKLIRRYNFDRSLSIADANEARIVWPNVPLIVARAYLDNLPVVQRIGAYLALDYVIKTMKEPAFINDTVSNFLFEGSKRELFEYIQSLDKFKFVKPWPLKDNKFALLYGKNNTWDPTVDRPMTMSTGFGIDQSYQDLNQYIFINGSSTLPFWQSQPPACNLVRGTDGEFFSPFLDHPQFLEVYSLDICRKVQLKYRQNYRIKGISALKFTLDEKSLQSGQKNPANQCYCLARDYKGVPKAECNLDGLIDLSTCANPNVVASGAHFLFGSPELSTRVSGVTPPNATLHEPTIYVEPNTGLTLDVNVPFQFNVRLEKGGLKIFKFFNDSEPLMLPLLWVTESSTMTDDQAYLLRSRLLLLESWLVSMVLGGAIIFVLAIFVIAFILCLRYRESRVIVSDSAEADPLIRPDESEEPERQSASQPNNYQTI